MISACLIVRKPSLHPLAILASKKVAEYTGIHTGNAYIYQLQGLRNYSIYKVDLLGIALDIYYPTHYYIAVSDRGESILLKNPEDLNRLIKIENISIKTDTIAWSIALLLFNMNNLSDTLRKKYIITNVNIIPGHLKKLNKKNLKESKSLHDLIKNSFYHNSREEWLTGDSCAYEFFMKMMGIYDSVYVDKTINLNDRVYSPTVKQVDSSFVVTFFTWELPLGVIKKWVVTLENEGIAHYCWETIAMFIGEYRLGIGFSAGYFNNEWRKNQ